jgi:hypothetical protein
VPSGTGSAQRHEIATRATPLAAAEDDLRPHLDVLLARQAVLGLRLSRARLRGDHDVSQVADALLSRNGPELSAALRESDVGAQAPQVEPRLSDHAAAQFEYASVVAEAGGRGSGITAPVEPARRRLEESTMALVGVVQPDAAGGVVTGSASAAMQGHATSLVEAADAYARADYARAFDVQRREYSRMFDLGAVMDAARPGNEPVDPVQSRLGMLMTEHDELLVDVVRSGLAGHADFLAATSALDANTADLVGAIEGTLGTEAAVRWSSLWADRVDALVTYAAATADGDRTGRAAARDKLQAAGGEFAALVAGSTGGRLAQEQLVAAIDARDALLLDGVDAYAAGDYSAAEAVSSDRVHESATLTAAVADAVTSSLAAQAPRGGAQTGLGGLAPSVGGT